MTLEEGRPPAPRPAAPRSRADRLAERRRRRRRRLLLPACLLLALVGLVVGLVAAIGGGPTTAAPTGPRPRPDVAAATSGGEPVPGGGPLRVLEVGDSLGIDLGEQLVSQLQGAAVTVTMAAKGDTGLANSSFYDWPATLETLLQADRPQLVVVFMGANDDQGLSGTYAPPGTAAWDTGYAERVQTMVDEIRRSGADVVWVGMPPMATPSLSAWMQHVDQLVSGLLVGHRDELYLASAGPLGSPGWQYVEDAPGPTGAVVELRTPDGVHLTAAGGAVLAHAVLGAAVQRWHLVLTPSPPPTTPPDRAASATTSTTAA